ncbi:rhodanese-like domain-containing protein [Pseudoalteromonas sp. SMS1]|uniref:rhodanese-like domain-containing protein n=1 Tax=Pseudoalteromonas sp. SMS1 TaxID=2908894 RepID=UPI001F182A66|nr:rhodanese-like domain-containing protein [Pseudoalteromonas sp. SMS1]MCF2859926.1 rhodanese-like domain-containing protein [Pseudoalteromonas sp. SMS1]
MLISSHSLVQSVKGSLRCIGAERAKDELTADQTVLIDVREPHEHQQQAPKNAINIPRGLIEFILPKKVPNPDAALFVHCAIGGRAVLAAEQLHRLGYTNVTVIDASVAEICDVIGC